MNTLQDRIKSEVMHLDAVQPSGRVVRQDRAALLAAGYALADGKTFRPLATLRRGVRLANRWYDVFLTVRLGRHIFAKRLNP